jgi:hypothetical protein
MWETYDYVSLSGRGTAALRLAGRNQIRAIMIASARSS